MSIPGTLKPFLSVEDYLAGEARSDIRHEYLDGQVYAMTGASRAPCLLIEVLSESTARTDRREKLLAYQTLPSLEAYLLVEQDARRVEIYRRDSDWRVEYIEHGDIPLPCLDATLPMAEIYQDVAESLTAG